MVEGGEDVTAVEVDQPGDELADFLAAHKADAKVGASLTDVGEVDEAAEKERQIAVDKKLKGLVGNKDLLDYLGRTDRSAVLHWYDATALDSNSSPYPQVILRPDGTIASRTGNTKFADMEAEYVLVQPDADGMYELDGQRQYVNPQMTRLRTDQRGLSAADYLKANPQFREGGIFVARRQVGGLERGAPLAEAGFMSRTSWGAPAATPDSIQKNLMTDLKSPAVIPPLGK